MDDAGPDTGSIANGWLLFITVPTIFTVNSTADPGDGVCDPTECTLRETLAAAGDGDLINFSPLFNTPQTINLLTALPDITKSVTIQGPGANLLTVRRADEAPAFGVFIIPASVTNGVAISGMTIANGRKLGLPSYGGGIDSQSYLALRDVHVTGNHCDSAGGGVALLGDGLFTSCTFSGNSSGQGGAIDYEGASGQTLRIVNSTISGNTSDIGCGIANITQATLEIISSTIVHNTGSSGVATRSTATTTLRNTIIASNSQRNLERLDSGVVSSGGFNLSDNYNNAVTTVASDITSATPRLAPLARYGGQTPNHALLGGSPALDAGNSSGLPPINADSNAFRNCGRRRRRRRGHRRGRDAPSNRSQHQRRWIRQSAPSHLDG